MRLIFSLLFFLWGKVLLGQSEKCEQVLIGQIFDRSTEVPLPFATITILGTKLGVVADDNGLFQIEGVCEGEIHLVVRFTGYKTMVHHHDFHHTNPQIFLAPDETELESVIVEDSRTQELNSISLQRKEVGNLSLISSNVSDLTEDLSGVSSLKTGANISKPIIHGLHSNRVLVINDGVRHAYQVWGQEHAPEIDPSHVDQIELVKGAGTVKYGPEALGGVILYNSRALDFDQKLSGEATYAFQSNGRSSNTKVNLGQGTHRFVWNAGAFGAYQGDLKSPDYILSNTGKKEYGASFNTLLHQPLFDLQVSGSYLNQELGILRGSIVGNLEDLQRAIEQDQPIPTFRRTYDIQNPRQVTEHGLIKTNLAMFLGEHEFNIQYAVQRNLREEYDVRRGELNDRPVIDLMLKSQSLEAEWIQPKIGIWSGQSGIQVYTQNSVNVPGSNSINFVPDYEVVNAGIFTVQSLNVNQTTLEVGGRIDYQTLEVADTIRDVTIYGNKVNFANATYTIGFRKKWGQYEVFSNIGSAWRPPNVSELYSFGYHNSRIQFGLWRYSLEPSISTPLTEVFDESDRNVESEKSIKWVSGLEIKKKKLTAEFVFFANQINHYIFLRPFGVTTNVAGTFPYFIYDQTNALFLGSDSDIRFQHNDLLTSELKLSYVYATELINSQPFIEIPPFNTVYSLAYKKGNLGIGLNLNYTAQKQNVPTVINPINFQNGNAQVSQSEIFDFMSPPEQFLLFGLSADYLKNNWSVALNVRNLFNKNYRVYTDRLRYFSDAPGRNISLGVGYNF